MIPAAFSMSDGIGLVDCWRIIRRYLRLICGLLAITLLVTGVTVYLMTPDYTASSTLLIQPEPAQVLDIRELISEDGSTEEHDYYKTQYDLLKSRDLAAEVIRNLDLEHSPLLGLQNSEEHSGRLVSSLVAPFGRWFTWLSPAPVRYSDADTLNAKAVDAYLQRLKVEPKIGTRLVVVSFRAPDAAMAARVADAHVHQYIRRGLELRSESRRSAVKFLDNELVEIKQRVEQSEAALNTYRHQKGIVAFDVQDSKKIAEQRMEDLTKALTEAETKRITAEAQMHLMHSGDYESLPQVIINPTITALKPQVARLQAQYANMSTAFNPQYPKLAELKAELIAARLTLGKEIGGVAKSVQRDYNSAAEQELKLREELSADKERDLALNDASLQDAVLARAVETNRELYKNVLLRMQQIQVGEQAPVTNISVVDRAFPPLRPSAPKKRRDLTISGLLALLCGIGLAFVLDQVDNRLKTSEEMEKYLQLPNLAVAPDFKLLSEANVTFHRPGLLWRLFGAGNSLGKTPHAYNHLPARGDVYRSIRSALLFSRAGWPPKKILVTSAIQGEGKTWTAVHTALAFAQTGAATLLIDADLRRARCHDVLETENTAGLSDVLVGLCEPQQAIRFIEERNLFLLTAGSRVPNPAELLTSPKMLQILDLLASRYEYILIDSAPIMYASDTVGIATMADGVVLIAGARTPKYNVRRASERLSFVGANVLGVVLNQVDINHPDHKEYSRYYFSYEKAQGSFPSPQRDRTEMDVTP
jgi:succinoglycan biosynthesis transport protein ExoP